MLKQTTLKSAYCSISNCSFSSTGSTCSSSTTSPCRLPRPRTRPTTVCPPRHYATVRDRKGPDFRDNMNWPCRKTDPMKPTPYEIFEIKKGEVYSKQKYYELVKLYHPDKSNHHPDVTISTVERLERYRLVVQAHEILSDPVKRKAYDTYGAGWLAEQRSTPNRHTRGYSNRSGKEYGHGAGYDSSPFGNATWEDWERWYRQQDPDHRQAYTGTYMNPNAFASFVIVLAVLTGVLQATRAGQYSESMTQKVDAFTAETNEFMTTRAAQLRDNGMGSDGRVKHFLEKRDPTKYGLKDEEEKTYRKMFIHDEPPKNLKKDKSGD